MAEGKITRHEIVDDRVLNIGREYAESLRPALEANKRWVESFEPLKKSALEYSNLEKNFKTSSSRKEIIKLQQEEEKLRKQTVQALEAEEKLRKQAAQALKAEADAKAKSKKSIQEEEKVKQAILNTERKELQLKAQKERAQKRTQKLTVQEREDLKILNRNKREAAKMSSTLATEYEKQSTKLEQLRRKYKDVALTEGESSKRAKELRTQISQLDSSLKKVDANVGQFQRNVGNYPSALKNATAAAKQFGSAMGMVGGAFFVANVIRDATNRIKEFDSEMQSLAGITNRSREELKSLELEIINVAGESPKTSTEVAKLANSLVSLGKTEGEVKLLLKPINDLSIALKANSDEAGEFLVQTLNAFGKGADSGQEFADIIAKIRTSTALDFQRLRDSMGYVAPTANALGLSLQRTGAIIGTLNDNGIKAARAGRLMNTSFGRLNQKGLSLEDALEKINNSSDKLATSTELFGSESATLGLILADNTDKVDEYEEAFNDAGGSLDSLTEKEMESMENKLKSLDSAWEKLILSIENGEGALGNAFKSMVEGATSVLEVIEEASRSQENWNEGGISSAIDEIRNSFKKFDEDSEIDLSRVRDEIRRTEQQLNMATRKVENTSAFSKIWSAGEFKKANASVEKFTKKLEILKKIQEEGQEALSEYVEDQEDLGKDEAMLEQARNVKYLKKQISELKEEQENLTLADKQRSNEINNKIKEYQKEIDAILGVEKAAKESNNTIINLNKFRLKQQITINNEIIKNEKATYDERFDAIKERYQEEIDLALIIADEKQNITSKLSDDELKLIKNQGQIAKDIKSRLNNEELLEIEKFIEKRRTLINQSETETDAINIEQIKREAKIAENIKKTQLENEIRLENEAFQAKQGIYEGEENATELRERRIAQIKERYARQALQQQLKATEELLANENLSKDQRVKYEKEVATIKRELSEFSLDNQTENLDDQKEQQSQYYDFLLQQASKLGDVMRDITSAIFDERIQRIDEEIQRNDERYDRWLENENLTEEQQQEIEQRKEEKRKELEKKKQKEKRKQAIIDKSISVAQTSIATAQAVMQTYAQLGAIAGSVPAAIVAAIGALQVGAIIATPIPKYAKGTENHPGGPALVGEERPEVISEPGKKPYIVDSPTFLDLKKGTKVAPSLEDYDTMMRASMLASVDINNNNLNQFKAQQAVSDNKDLINEMKLTRKAIEKKKTNVFVKQQKQIDFNNEIFKLKNINWKA